MSKTQTGIQTETKPYLQVCDLDFCGKNCAVTKLNSDIWQKQEHWLEIKCASVSVFEKWYFFSYVVHSL